jgi:hypothetical protein
MTFRNFKEEAGKLLKPVMKDARISGSRFMHEAEKVHKNETEWNTYLFGTPSVWKRYDNYQIRLFPKPKGKC